MVINTSEVHWHGTPAAGRGKINITSCNLNQDYSFKSRFGGELGLNPEELMGASLAACFSMALADVLHKSHHEPKVIHSVAKTHLEKRPEGYVIPCIDLYVLVQTTPELQEDELAMVCEQARQNCPVATVMTGVEINYHLRTKL